MSEDFDDDKESEMDEIVLSYKSYYDPDSMSVYIKFSGFLDNEQMEDFINYLDPYIPLILFNSKVKH